MLALTVLHAFGDYAIGQTITDATAIEQIRSGKNAQLVVPANLPDPEPEEPSASASGPDAPSPSDAAPKSEAKAVGKRG